MKFSSLFFAALLALSVCLPSGALANSPAFKLVTSQEVAESLKSNNGHVYIFDANRDNTRQEYGIVPEAVLLTSPSNYDLALLPADKSASLVFYCANERCTASHTAAERAVAAGYTNVKVMSDGIAGWKKAGLSAKIPAA